MAERHQIWVPGHAASLQRPVDGDGGMLDVVPADAYVYDVSAGPEARQIATVPGTRFTGLDLPQGRLFMMRGSGSNVFQVPIPFPRDVTRTQVASVVVKPGERDYVEKQYRLRRVFFKYFSFPHGPDPREMTHVSSVALYDAGSVRSGWGALYRNAEGHLANGGFLLESSGVTSATEVPSIDTVDTLKRRVNMLHAEYDSMKVDGPLTLTLTVSRDSIFEVYGGICFVAFGAEVEVTEE